MRFPPEKKKNTTTQAYMAPEKHVLFFDRWMAYAQKATPKKNKMQKLSILSSNDGTFATLVVE